MSNLLGLAYGDSDSDTSEPDNGRESNRPAQASEPKKEVTSEVRNGRSGDGIIRRPPPVGVSGESTPGSIPGNPNQQHLNRSTASSRSSPTNEFEGASGSGRGPHSRVYLQGTYKERKVHEAQTGDETTRSETLRALLRPAGFVDDDEMDIPSEPDGEPNPITQAKIEKWLAIKASGTHFNDRLEQTHAFRNPSIMSKLIEYLDLDELGSNYPKDIFDPHSFPKEAFFDQIAQAQDTLQQQQQQFAASSIAGPNANPQLAAAVAKAQQRAIQFVSNVNRSTPATANKPLPTASQAAPAPGKKRSKWDQPADAATKKRR
ncbi:HCNGP-like protein-domain-containing protein [Fimicolochytrium jonesii]|uniref:HCNGP-like protein-domain-containing protein n=1 Tax=Fimicolochytrium jonesii TaxID=1396493 RepID=UPI0022FE61EF|nr:HCNGP-like protein-domain-containing protein [Fimicolochytrium jonesii]KAI8824457.1 HCNGP-like protein-domain-containing protein [Fimicolochytrium jonesii]